MSFIVFLAGAAGVGFGLYCVMRGFFQSDWDTAFFWVFVGGLFLLFVIREETPFRPFSLLEQSVGVLAMLLGAVVAWPIMNRLVGNIEMARFRRSTRRRQAKYRRHGIEP